MCVSSNANPEATKVFQRFSFREAILHDHIWKHYRADFRFSGLFRKYHHFSKILVNFTKILRKPNYGHLEALKIVQSAVHGSEPGNWRLQWNEHCEVHQNIPYGSQIPDFGKKLVKFTKFYENFVYFCVFLDNGSNDFFYIAVSGALYHKWSRYETVCSEKFRSSISGIPKNW